MVSSCFLVVLCVVVVGSNAAACDDGSESCHVEAAKMGSSMLQTREKTKAASKSKASTSPLKVKVDNLEGDMTKVKAKVAALEAVVGNPVPTPATAAAAAMLARQAPRTTPTYAYAAPVNSYTGSAGLLQIDGKIDGAVDAQQQQQQQYPTQQQYAQAYPPQQLVQSSPTGTLESLVRTIRQDPEPAAAAVGAGGPLKVRVGTLETDVSDMRSRIMSLENEVNGKGSAVLLQESDELGDASLKGRIMSMETTVDDLKTRVSGLEHTVVGSAPTA